MTSPTEDINAVLRSQDFYRLKQPLTSAGNIFEIDVSARAVFVGPDSDIAEARIQYANPDDSLGLGVSTADVSVNGPFVGGVDVDLGTDIGSTGQPARILAYPVDVVNPAYVRPTGIPSVPARRYNLPTYIDLIFALADLPAIPAVRADRTFRLPMTPFENANGAGNGSTDIVIPIYGRRMVTVDIVTAVQYVADFFLVALQPGQDPWPHEIGSISQVGSSNVDTQTVVIKASGDVSSVTGSTSVPTTYTELAQPLPAVKGQMDLLVINLSTTTLIDGLRYADLFIKVTDREG